MKNREYYKINKPLLNSVFTGLFYFLFCWSIDFGDTTKSLFISLMLFLPGLTFPLVTCYFKKENIKSNDLNQIIHYVLSVGIYHGSVWLFTLDGQIKNITILAGFLGSLLFLLATKYLLKKDITLIQIAFVSIFSGLAFFPYDQLGRLGIQMGLAVFLWTVFNGLILNYEHIKTNNTKSIS